MQAEQGPDGDMGGFTRVLHSGKPDHLMDEIPTHVVDRLSNEHGFVVLSRPNAFVQVAPTSPHPPLRLLSTPLRHARLLSSSTHALSGEEGRRFLIYPVSAPLI